MQLNKPIHTVADAFRAKAVFNMATKIISGLLRLILQVFCLVLIAIVILAVISCLFAFISWVGSMVMNALGS